MSLTNISLVKAHFAKADPKILEVLEMVKLNEWFDEQPSTDHFYNLTRNIIYQQLAGKAASAIFSRFEALVGGNVTPENILKFEDQSFRDVGLSWAKAKYIKDLAAKVQSGEVVLSNIDTLDNESVIIELTKVKGIGRWTAEMFLLFTLRRENIFSYGDLGLKNGFIKLYGSDADLKSVIASWSPYESYGSISLWHYLDNR
ncbi:MAG: DNA-3-methyladenine glycosylase 2 family protein [Microgenomates group bacterium]